MQRRGHATSLMFIMFFYHRWTWFLIVLQFPGN